ncbi:SAM domain and HD [Bulinus truncatus]|nr:SAM domain and HD [Bulinus truncatus]
MACEITEKELEEVGLPDYFIKDYLEKKFDLQSVTIEKLLEDYEQATIKDTDCWDIITKLKKLKTVRVFNMDVKKESKIFNDPIHGHIVLHPVCLAIIDTPEFQRLRNIKQLGMCYYVYPGASHNRFEHSLGVCYLAGQFARTLQKNQLYLGITEKDILCVEIAGLCHDLGHGPFSHVFDGLFIPAICPDNFWTHEKASLDMFDFMIQNNGLKEGVLKGVLDEKDILFIKEMIYGPLDKNIKELKGREKHKHYLYEIVSNKRNGIDVDKWDYFARDCHHLGIKNNFDHNRYMKFARVLHYDNEWQICIRDKEISNLYNMFYTRFTLHKTAYQHRVTKTLEVMLTHALVKANEDLKITVDGQDLKMSDCIEKKNMLAYCQLTDSVLFKILESRVETEKMKEAQDIIQRILKRKLYTLIYESDSLDSVTFTKKEDEIKKEIAKKVKETCEKEYDFGVQIIKFDFGMKHENPVEKLLVYSKVEEDKAFKLKKEQVSRILGPVYFSELFIRVISYDQLESGSHKKAAEEALKKAAEECIKEWQHVE